MRFSMKMKSVLFVAVSVILGGNLLFFGFQNCGRARMGIQDSASQNKGLGNPDNPGSGVIDKIPSCPVGQIAIGLTADFKSACVSAQSRAGDTCNVGEYAYRIEAGNVSCILISDRAAIPNKCEFNRILSTYTDTGTMVCVRMPAVLPNYNCADGKPVRGVHNSVAVCDDVTPVDPLTFACPAGQYLENILNNQPVCRPILPNVTAPITCPAGQALVGVTVTNTAVCQQIMPVPQAAMTCAGDQYASNIVNNQLTCANVVYPDLAHYCTEGQYLASISQQGFLCQNLPGASSRFNGTCPSGQYLAGFNEAGAICRAFPSNGSFNYLCPRGFYAAGFNNGSLVCKPFDDTSVLTCSPGATRSCDINNGMGAQVCAATGKAWGACQLTTCNSGYENKNGICVKTECQPGFKMYNGGQCEDLTPPMIDVTQIPKMESSSGTDTFKFKVTDEGTGVDKIQCKLDDGAYQDCVDNMNYTDLPGGRHRFEVKASDKHGNWSSVVYNWTVLGGSFCKPNTFRDCAIANGAGSQVCIADGSAFGACAPVKCNDGYVQQNGACVKRTDCPTCPKVCKPNEPKVCEVTNGVGNAFCKTDGSGFGACQPIDCLPGFILQNGKCVLREPPKCLDCPTTCRPGHIKSCKVENGFGIMRCAQDGSEYGACETQSCRSGFKFENGQCVVGTCNSCECGNCPKPVDPVSCGWDEVLIGNRCVADDDWKNPVCPKKQEFSGFMPPWAFDSSFVDNTCKRNIEIWSKYKAFSMTEKSKSAIATDRYMHVEFASYNEANTYSIYAIDKKGGKTLIFQPCWVSTDHEDELNCKPKKNGRPRTNSIRSYKVKVPAGTVKLYFSPATKKPFYLKVRGLCDFKKSPDGMTCKHGVVKDQLMMTEQ
jgi:hypothetical protein